jgi:hypothetical protein
MDRVVKGLFDRGLSAEESRQLFRRIDWLLKSPGSPLPFFVGSPQDGVVALPRAKASC